MDIDKFLNNATKRKTKSLEIKEIDIELTFCKYASNLKCKALKLILLNKKGFPDRTVICPGARVFFIEFKRKGKKPSPAQRLVQNLLESFGFEYYICDVIGQAESHLDKFLLNSFD